MVYNLAEQLAIIKAVDEVIRADGQVNYGEMSLLNHIVAILRCDRSLIEEARKIDAKEGLAILAGMPANKKKALAIMLEEMANADGKVHEKEIDLILKIFSATGIHIE